MTLTIITASHATCKQGKLAPIFQLLKLKNWGKGILLPFPNSCQGENEKQVDSKELEAN